MRGHPIDHPETVATATDRHPQSGTGLQAQAESGVGSMSCPNRESSRPKTSCRAGRDLLRAASAASLAVRCGTCTRKIPERSLVVCTLTGHGLKDPAIAIAQSSAPPLKIEARLTEVERLIAAEIGR